MHLLAHVVHVKAHPPGIGVLAPGHELAIGNVGRVPVSLRALQGCIHQGEPAGLDGVAAGHGIRLDHQHARPMTLGFERRGETGDAGADDEHVCIRRRVRAPAARHRQNEACGHDATVEQPELGSAHVFILTATPCPFHAEPY